LDLKLKYLLDNLDLQPDQLANLNLNFDPSTGGSRSLNMIRNWLHNCLSGHDQCASNSRTDYLPTRLLEIEGSAYHLAMRFEIPQRSRYVTLSHCWGKKDHRQCLQLKKETIDELRNGKLIASLPKTFRDAIKFAKTIGIRHIWIDRLCILQDSREDWATEAANMREVYEHAFATIAALGAADDEGGLFFDRSPRDVAPTIVHLKKDLGADARAYISPEEYTWSWHHHFFFESALLNRGWVVQERFLSSRVIYFGRNIVFWECWRTGACEILPLSIRNHRISRYTPITPIPHEMLQGAARSWKPLLENPSYNPTEHELAPIFFDWSQMLSAYCKCDLTFSSDKLVALSGLASRFKSTLESNKPGQHRYLAGIWEETLPEALIWTPFDDTRRYKQYVAPSWSWASVNRAVISPETLNPEYRTCHSVYRDGQIDAGSYLDTGAVKSGWIKLWTALVHLELDLGDLKRDGTYRPPKVVLRDMMTNTVVKLDTRYSDRVLRCDDNGEEFAAEVYAAPVVTHSFHYGHETSILVLVGSNEGDRNTYRRIGVLQMMLGELELATALVATFTQQEIALL
jgi:Heterokaryon incompatibility protein (HET)